MEFALSMVTDKYNGRESGCVIRFHIDRERRFASWNVRIPGYFGGYEFVATVGDIDDLQSMVSAVAIFSFCRGTFGRSGTRDLISDATWRN